MTNLLFVSYSSNRVNVALPLLKPRQLHPQPQNSVLSFVSHL
ncbi:Uncharacterised protein [Streptococcus pneumoniae]|nr:Uncharacterised protein [Streptococcus pneumoniae]